MTAGRPGVRQALLYPFARRFFAGTTLEAALDRAGYVNRLGMGATLDFLGEGVTKAGEAEEARAEYARVIDAVAKGGLDASVAVKLTHVGLDISPALAQVNVTGLAERARRNGVFLWIDMEGSRYTEDTLSIYKKLIGEYEGSVGVALQACLNRTRDDLAGLVAEGATVRLVKGAYREPPETAIQDEAGIRVRYLEMMEYLFEKAGSFAVGTHDRKILNRAIELSRGYGGKFEFQMLMGMRDDMKRRLAAGGHRVVEYVPYGTDWYGYGIRRLKEKKRNALYFAQGFLGR